MIKLIHPKVGTVREIEDSDQLKLRLLKRAGFILYKNYKPKKKKEVVPDPTVAEIVAKNKEEGIEETDEPTIELAIHVSPAARALIEKHELDPALIKGTGKEGAITKPDVSEYLESLEPVKQEPEEVVPAEDIVTHDDLDEVGKELVDVLEDAGEVIAGVGKDEVLDAIEKAASDPPEVDGKYPEGEENRAEDHGPGKEEAE